MALSKEISSITITQNNASPSWSTALTTQDIDIDISPVFWNGEAFVELIDASLAQNLRALRLKVSLRWDHNTESSTIRGFINNVVADLTSTSSPENIGVRVYFDGSNYQVMIPEESVMRQVWKNQTTYKLQPEFNFISQQPLSSIPSYLEAP
tara:strand:+ start:2671 stop:3126 length:456 start_codon:yes stop_codon:yes gene_type:complete